jgi:hypothetical protein
MKDKYITARIKETEKLIEKYREQKEMVRGILRAQSNVLEDLNRLEQGALYCLKKLAEEY